MSKYSDPLDAGTETPRQPEGQAIEGFPRSEVEALHELKKLGVEEVYDIKIDNLLHLAHQRREALGQLREAEEACRQAVSSRDKAKVSEASQKLGTALEGMRQVKYPDREEFNLRRQELNADITRAEALQEAIEIWWWQRFSEHVADLYRGVARPGGTPANALNQAEALEKNWPEQECVRSSWRQQAKEALEDMREELEKARFTTRLAEAEEWLKQAEEYLVPQEAHGKLDPLTALTCLAQAKVILEGLKEGLRALPQQYADCPEQDSQRFRQAQERLGNFRKSAQEKLPKWLSKQRQGILQGLKEECGQKLRAWSSSNPQKDLTEVLNAFLAEEDHRDLVDVIRFHLYLSPEVESEAWLKELVLTRQDNLLRARQLLREVKVWWQSPGKKSYIYWALKQLEEANECDPDSNEIQNFKKEVEHEWHILEKDFNFYINQVSTYLNRVELHPSEAALQQDIGSNLAEAYTNLQEAEGILKRQKGKRPLVWEEAVQDAESRLNRLKGLYRQVREIAERWGNSDVSLQELIEETKDFMEKHKKLPGSMKSYLKEQIQERARTLSGEQTPPGEALELQDLSKSISVTKQPEM